MYSCRKATSLPSRVQVSVYNNQATFPLLSKCATRHDCHCNQSKSVVKISPALLINICIDSITTQLRARLAKGRIQTIVLHTQSACVGQTPAVYCGKFHWGRFLPYWGRIHNYMSLSQSKQYPTIRLVLLWLSQIILMSSGCWSSSLHMTF